LASNLVHVLYVIDEPTTGLHPRDTVKLLDALRGLRERGNTVVVIEHDPKVIAAADHVIDLGPGAGEEGGSVVFQGFPPAPTHMTISLPQRRRKPTGHLKLTSPLVHNLRPLTIELPLGVLCTITGVSGAGKRTLAELLHTALCLAKKKK